jgi:hypothetical protein
LPLAWPERIGSRNREDDDEEDEEDDDADHRRDKVAEERGTVCLFQIWQKPFSIFSVLRRELADLVGLALT